MSYKLGIDVGSTTLKLIVLDESNSIIFKSYERHFSRVRELLFTRLSQLSNLFKDNRIQVAITGSAGLGIAESTGIDFVQEVFSISNLISERYPEVDCAIELGGEDAKIIFFGNTTEERMNGTCAGGTGAFIDQMATLLNVSTEQLDALSLRATDIYPIASRCGVFAKTDIQPLINQGAGKENIAASIFSAVVDQTITGLAQGRKIEGKVLFLGGPLTFLKGLQKAFVKTLNLCEEDAIFPQNAQYFVALGSAIYASKANEAYSFAELLGKIKNQKVKTLLSTMPPLFKSSQEYDDFIARHNASHTCLAEENYSGKAYLGLDSGSTTTKLVLIDEHCNILYQYYASSKGNPLDIIKSRLEYIYESFPNITIAQSAVTGYGEDLVKNAFNLDIGVVETVAHYTAAKFFNPNVDFIIDIGGQDMKCFGIKNDCVDSVSLNEACSSGCGSFLETFAASLGYSIREFAQLALFAQNPVDLGTRCTVFMNSSVKQAQKNGASIEDISAGLSISVVKNAIYKVLRVTNATQLGDNIVVQGGTFLNDAVLRAFEQLMEKEVTRPDIAGLMGAFGAALIAKESHNEKTEMLTYQEVQEFTHTSQFVRCGMCTNHCSLTINHFSGNRKMISGNRCERPLHKKSTAPALNMYEYKRNYLNQYGKVEGKRAVIGIPFVLNMLDTLPFWHTFFKELGFGVAISEQSSRNLYKKGQHTIPSDTICYGAKLVHGHILSLIEQQVDAIFYPCMSYNIDEKSADNYFHCPVVAYYPEVIKNNVGELEGTKFLYPYITLNNTRCFVKTMLKTLQPLDETLTKAEVSLACKKAFQQLAAYKEAVLEEGKRILDIAHKNHTNVLVFAGRPYHIDSEINHGIDKMVCALGFAVLSEDSLPLRPLQRRTVLNQWTYHARMYNAADFVCKQDNTELVQLISFGCGLDAVTSDEIKEELLTHRKLYTQLKIDEISNLGAIKIRMRSLMAAMEERKHRNEQ